jgi:hypothetical protein
MTEYKATSLWDFAATLARNADGPAIEGNDINVAYAVLEAHSFDGMGRCQECDGNDRVAYWPCATVRAVAACFGIEAP